MTASLTRTVPHSVTQTMAFSDWAGVPVWGNQRIERDRGGGEPMPGVRPTDTEARAATGQSKDSASHIKHIVADRGSAAQMARTRLTFSVGNKDQGGIGGWTRQQRRDAASIRNVRCARPELIGIAACRMAHRRPVGCFFLVASRLVGHQKPADCGGAEKGNKMWRAANMASLQPSAFAHTRTRALSNSLSESETFQNE